MAREPKASSYSNERAYHAALVKHHEKALSRRAKDPSRFSTERGHREHMANRAKMRKTVAALKPGVEKNKIAAVKRAKSRADTKRVKKLTSDSERRAAKIRAKYKDKPTAHKRALAAAKKQAKEKPSKTKTTYKPKTGGRFNPNEPGNRRKAKAADAYGVKPRKKLSAADIARGRVGRGPHVSTRSAHDTLEGRLRHAKEERRGAQHKTKEWAHETKRQLKNPASRKGKPTPGKIKKIDTAISKHKEAGKEWDKHEKRKKKIRKQSSAQSKSIKRAKAKGKLSEKGHWSARTRVDDLRKAKIAKSRAPAKAKTAAASKASKAAKVATRYNRPTGDTDWSTGKRKHDSTDRQIDHAHNTARLRNARKLERTKRAHAEHKKKTSAASKKKTSAAGSAKPAGKVSTKKLSSKKKGKGKTGPKNIRTGAKGGRYYMSKSGRKVYLKRK